MSGANRDIIPDPDQVLFPAIFLRKEGRTYMFGDYATLERVTRAIINTVFSTGKI